MLNEDQIKKLKDKIGDINIIDKRGLFNKIDRTPYETGTLFLFCYDKLRKVDFDPLKEIVSKCKEIGEEYRFFEMVTKYPNLVLKSGADMRIQYSINQNREFVEDVIGLVSDNFVTVALVGGNDQILGVIRGLKDKK